MEEIDLSDRKGLIAMAYGDKYTPVSVPSTAATSVNGSTSTLPKPKKEKRSTRTDAEGATAGKSSTRVSCPLSLCCLLFLLTLAAVAASALITYHLTKNKFMGQATEPVDAEGWIPDQRRNGSEALQETLYEEDYSGGPTAAELRLPRDLKPVWYNLTVKTYLPGYIALDEGRDFTFDGSLTMKIRVESATDKIVLSSSGLNYTDDLSKFKLMQDSVMSNRIRRDLNETVSEGESLLNAVENNNATVTEEEPAEGEVSMISTTTMAAEEVTEASSTTTEEPEATTARPDVYSAMDTRIVKIVKNDTVDMVTFYLDKPLKAGDEVYFKIPFTGSIGENLGGFYRSSYLDKQGKKKFVAVSDFEPTDARKFVPCFDEPNMKAPWKVKIVHPKGTTALSNGIETSSGVTANADWMVTKFKETLPMSTYLLAAFVGEFNYKEATSKRGTRVRVYSRPEAINSTAYPLDVAVSGLNYFEDFYQINYPMEKLDLLGVQDYKAGAMENWGLITFTENSLLFDPKQTTLVQKAGITNTVLHELSHQWFGNLVTMDWWNDLWLNEGFATMLENIATDAYNKDFHADESFIGDGANNVLEVDSKSSSHPLIMNITKAMETRDVFDAITYDKGSAILRMIKGFMGDENFKKGITNYLNRFKYQNARAKDLWDALGEAVPSDLTAWNGEKLDMKEFADKWALQMGYPVLEVYRLGPKQIEISQKRFKENALTPEKAKYRNAKFWYKWDVPMFHEINGEKKPLVWLHEAYRMNLKPDEVLILNADSLGYYRVNYDDRGWENIRRQLVKDHTTISPKSRARLIDDAFALAAKGDLPYETALNLLDYLHNDADYLPWQTAMEAFEGLLETYADEADGKHIKEYVLRKVKPIYDTVDWSAMGTETEKEFQQHKLRRSAISLVCDLGHRDCNNKLFEQYTKNFKANCGDDAIASQCTNVPPTLRKEVYCEGVARGAEDTHDFILKKYAQETENAERLRLIDALACSRDPYTLNSILAKAADPEDETFRLRDRADLIEMIASEPVGALVIHDFFNDNWKKLESKLGSSGELVDEIIDALPMKNEQRLRMYEKFLEVHPSIRKYSSFTRLLEKARTNVDWSKKHRKALNEYFEKANKAATAA